eukprot:TRINITY_DN2586_c0_g1_i4.p1 TRINITY_DN2586_c0_g1~~TRINITY_DN2586_c0_g1_i4.p1  ORF type:complete len:291 (-),score=40.08 TRINITY_DN2586_c0_g1_i4:46-885(-)
MLSSFRDAITFPCTYDPLTLLTSSTRLVSPYGLFVYRVLSCVFLGFVKVYDVSLDANAEENRFFTILNFMLLIIYYILLVIASIRVKSWRLEDNNGHYESVCNWRLTLDHKFSLLCKIINILYEILVCCTIGIVIVYWILLYHPGTYLSPPDMFINVTVHGLNALFMLMDLFLSRAKIYPGHVFYPIIWMSIYTCMAWTYYGVEQEWIYPFLNWSLKFSVLYYAGLFAGFILLYFLGLALCHLRDKVASKIHHRLTLPSADDRESTENSLKKIKYHPLP